ncbi:MAG: polysaccharide deacetylase family protein [Nitrospirae bacterium]|nr:polysaccharide deacetylase family protein [Nitrospirota bacterium]
MDSVFTVDVEDWYHILDIPSAPKMSEWASAAPHVEKDFIKLLDLISEKNVPVTCFFLGWIAERFPHLVKEAAARGHEIASHGYSHRLVYEMTEDEFYHDAVKSKNIIEDIAGRPVLGYRSAGFSITEDTPWYFENLIKAGYKYDSSVFPGPRGHGGLKSDRYGPYLVKGRAGNIIEFPITLAKFLSRRICFFGGGYLRLFPYPLIKSMGRRVLSEGRPVIFYVHPREVNPGHPRLEMNYKRRFKSYVNLKTTESKVSKILEDFRVITFERYIKKHKEMLEG